MAHQIHANIITKTASMQIHALPCYKREMSRTLLLMSHEAARSRNRTGIMGFYGYKTIPYL